MLLKDPRTMSNAELLETEEEINAVCCLSFVESYNKDHDDTTRAMWIANQIEAEFDLIAIDAEMRRRTIVN